MFIFSDSTFGRNMNTAEDLPSKEHGSNSGGYFRENRT